MKHKIIILASFIVLLAISSCKDSFLDVKPVGALDEATLSSEKGINKVLVSAYAMLDGVDNSLGIGGAWGSSASNFVFGSMAGGEANRGSEPGDQCPNMCPCIRHEFNPVNVAFNDRWKALYEGVKRTNTVIQLLAKAGTAVSADGQKNIGGQARFLRAWYHFQARIMWGKIPYMDEIKDAQLASGEIKSVANDTETYPNILADLKYAYENLPEAQDARAKANKWVAGALYGKVLMFAKDYATALTVLKDVVANGKTPLGVAFDLNASYADNFNVAFDNSKESVFAFQASAQDNAGAWNATWGDNLNTPGGGSNLGGAGFFTPTFYFVNTFKTDAGGLPAASPNNTSVMDPIGANPPAGTGFTQYSGNVDTRLDWTVGRNGVPFHDWGTYSTSWQRHVSAGPFAAKKNMIRQSQVGSSHDASIWFSAGGTSLNVNFIRFSDVLLLLAEAEIEAPGGSLANALTHINRVRNRAKSSPVVPFGAALGIPKTEPYAGAFASQAAARTALRLERVLELGLEGHRFFDLVRWGNATAELTAFYGYESPLPYQALGDLRPLPTYTGGAKQDYYAIPQEQVDRSQGMIKQN